MTLVHTRASLACVASVSNRVIARKLERKQKKVEGGGGGEKRRFLRSPPPPPSFMFFCPCPSFLGKPREETLATQARVSLSTVTDEENLVLVVVLVLESQEKITDSHFWIF